MEDIIIKNEKSIYAVIAVKAKQKLLWFYFAGHCSGVHISFFWSSTQGEHLEISVGAHRTVAVAVLRCGGSAGDSNDYSVVGKKQKQKTCSTFAPL